MVNTLCVVVASKLIIALRVEVVAVGVQERPVNKDVKAVAIILTRLRGLCCPRSGLSKIFI